MEAEKMGVRKQEQIMKIVISGIIIIVLGVAAVVKNGSDKKKIQQADKNIQEVTSSIGK
jgi:hypothetical protein